MAQIVGKSRPHVANLVRLLKLPEPVKTLVRAGKLSAGHARLLIGHVNALIARRNGDRRGLQRAAARRVGARDQRASPATPPSTRCRRRPAAASRPVKSGDTRALERRLSDALGLNVKVDHRGDGGTLPIKYQDLDQLDGVVRKLGG